MDLIKLVLNVNLTSSRVPFLKEKHKEVFKGIGKLKREWNIYLKDNTTPTVYPARRVPAAMQNKLKQELSRLEDLRIIEKVITPTEWVNSMVMVEKKDGSIRLCIHPLNLNKSIKRPHYPIPTLDDVTSKLYGAKIFTKLDARSGYWSIPLSEDSSYLTTFSTIYGRYRFKRMPFGIISAQDEFQRRMEDAFEGLEGFFIIIDDMIVYGATQEEHDERLAAILEHALAKGIRFNKDKCEFSASRVSYFGHIISSTGLQARSRKDSRH